MSGQRNEREDDTHPVLPEQRDILVREITAGFIVVDALYAVALLHLVADDAGLHGADP